MTLEGSERWRGTRLELAQTFLAVHPRPTTAPELAEATGRDPSNVRKAVQSMVGEGLLTIEKPVRRQGGSGMQAREAYRLEDAEVQQVEALLATKVVPGALEQGLQLVVAEASPARLSDLMAVVTEPEATSQLAWSAAIDGEPQTYLFAFEGVAAVAVATTLAAVLNESGIPSRRATVAQVSAGHRFLSEAGRTATAVSRISIRQATRRAAMG